MSLVSEAYSRKRRGTFLPGVDPRWEMSIYLKWYNFVHKSPERGKATYAIKKRKRQEYPEEHARYVAGYQAKNVLDKEKRDLKRAETIKWLNGNKESVFWFLIWKFNNERNRRLEKRRGQWTTDNTNRYYGDPQFRIAKLLRQRVRTVLKAQNAKKIGHTLELLGCSLEFFKNYIESHFTEGMNWENSRRAKWPEQGWEIDHTIACTKFDLTDPEQQKRCFHYSNHRPMWMRPNRQKYNIGSPIQHNPLSTVNIPISFHEDFFFDIRKT